MAEGAPGRASGPDGFRAVVLDRPLAEQRSTFIAGDSSASGPAGALRDEPNWSFRVLEAGHWPMVSAPDELVELLR